MTMNRKGQKTEDPARKIGRPRKFTPERFWAVFEEYRKWAKATPIYVSKVSAGQTISLPCERPLTLTGFCRFAEISRDSFYNYEAKTGIFGAADLYPRGHRGRPTRRRFGWGI